jgi:hypothetical protein
VLKKICLSICMTLSLAALALAQGTSPVKVTSIAVAPASFKAGDAVTITVQVENSATRPYGCVGTPYFQVSVNIFKAEPYTTTNMIWQGEQALTTPLAAGERRTVTLSMRWTVPNLDVSSFHVTAWSPLCAPDEFGQFAKVIINKSCVYTYQPRLEIIRTPIRDLQILRKK